MEESLKLVAKTFRATLERGDPRLGWVVIRIPFVVSKVWGARGTVRVKGEINGFAFRSSLFPTGDGGHTLLVNKRMQNEARASAGSEARFRLEPDTEERVASVPAELKKALPGDRAFWRWYDQLNYSTRKDISNWIAEPKGAEARARRADQLAERLLATMEAEHELPPMIRAAFAANPRAEQGWNRMPPSHRRAYLLAIFYYRTPEARARRLAKTVQDAYRYAAKD